MSTKIWNSLTEQEQNWLQEAANESVPYQRKLWKESESQSLKLAEEAGVKVIYPDKAPFIERVQSIYEQYREDERTYNLINRIRELE